MSPLMMENERHVSQDPEPDMAHCAAPSDHEHLTYPFSTPAMRPRVTKCPPAPAGIRQVSPSLPHPPPLVLPRSVADTSLRLSTSIQKRQFGGARDKYQNRRLVHNVHVVSLLEKALARAPHRSEDCKVCEIVACHSEDSSPMSREGEV